ncbi:DUF4846 domain-containing protein [Leptospira interrogans]|uniref:DUF4846 domain-containing protein n=1 Tax=Leptospira interrogans TaxID=173 RepID=UPI000297D6B3|nr:DUF4846 domain-containing protein [Leptospira interrogans]EKR82407.1 hypothetical protein LEP1GSC099_2424 [Leptospira interrogans str. UI 08452]EMN33605.1 hypothetical protein LEP1GSC084_0814 [Leptospira interrogans serovar Medanensis str. L0448]EMN38838.1 hypothetical protein LEP1GSC085_1116 [Leptospira interrogans str. L0996]EMN93741.1 hypothetical protein LEP1GSC110_4999 [Leptospira interrogans serovar Medanensis str. UT053]
MKLILTFANKFRKRILTLIQSLRFFLKLALIVFGVSSCVYADTTPSKVNEIALPSESTRVRFKKNSFSDFVQNLPLKSDRTLWTYKKENIIRRYDTIAILDVPLLFQSDLEQCADYTMRIWAEYHKQNNHLNRLYLFDYNGNQKFFSKSGLSYFSFLRKVFASSNSYSIKKGGKIISETDLKPGDLFVQNETGGIGHVSMILDLAENRKGEKFFLIGFSFMPAQEMHIERAPKEFGSRGWFTYSGFISHLKESYPYGHSVLRRF